jgi:UDP-GlcNAc:undecaprenyl-phosphate GlcNAc-1-phosphate transferase
MLEPSLGQYLALLVMSLISVGILTPALRKLAIKLDITDKPISIHKTHTSAVPYLGGIAIMIGIVVVIVAALITAGRSDDVAFALSLLIPAVCLGIVGLIDDLKNLTPSFRFIVQSIAGIFTAAFVLTSTSIGNPTNSIFLDALISVVWIVGITNAINFYDNLDGGAAGAVAVAGLGLFIVAATNGQFFIAATSIVLLGAMLGFLIWNRSPARIYMGDAGALFLGFIVSVLSLRLDPDVDNKMLSFSIPLLLLALPIMDTAVVVISRLKRGVSPFQGGRDHLSHRILFQGISKRKTAYLLWTLSALFTISAIFVSMKIFDNLIFLGLNLFLWMTLFAFFLRGFPQESTTKSH